MKYKNTWKSELFNDKKHNSCGNKLRTYRLFKDQFVFEPYLNWGTIKKKKKSYLIIYQVLLSLISGCYCLKYHFYYYIILLIKRITDYKCSDHLLKEARQIYFYCPNI
jgi:hypothetical protein